MQPPELATGDRLLCRGTLDAAGAALAANRIVVMTRGDVESQRRQRSRRTGRSAASPASSSAVDAAAQRVHACVRGAGRRRAEDGGGRGRRRERERSGATRRPRCASRREAGSSFAELAVGDQVRVLGQQERRTARASRAEKVVSGAFRVVRGDVAEVDAAKGTLSRARGRASGRSTVAVGGDTLLRRLPTMMVMRLLRGQRGRRGAGRPGAAAGGAVRRRGGGAGAGPARRRPGRRRRRPRWRGGPQRRGPPIPTRRSSGCRRSTLAELVKGDEIAVLGPKQTEADRMAGDQARGLDDASLPSGAGNSGRGGRGPGMGGGGADAFSDVLGWSEEETSW